MAIQRVGMALPSVLSLPFLLIFDQYLSISDWIPLKTGTTDGLEDFAITCIFIAWVVINYHLWRSVDPNTGATMEQDVFIRPYYSSLYCSAGIALNRRGDDPKQAFYTIHKLRRKYFDTQGMPILLNFSHLEIAANTTFSMQGKDIYVITTMWHEERHEMVSLLNSYRYLTVNCIVID